MTRFNVYVLTTGRLIQLSIHADMEKQHIPVDLKIDMFIKDPEEEEFHPVIGSRHPDFIEFQKLNPEQALNMQIRYCGVSAAKIKQAVDEFKVKFAIEAFSQTLCNN